MNHLSRDSPIASNKQKAASVSIKRYIIGKVESLYLAQRVWYAFLFYFFAWKLSFYLFYCWGKIALYCCISFSCTTKCISYMYTYIASVMSLPPSLLPSSHLTILGHPRAASWAELPVPYSRFPLATGFIHDSVYGMLLDLDNLLLTPSWSLVTEYHLITWGSTWLLFPVPSHTESWGRWLYLGGWMLIEAKINSL